MGGILVDAEFLTVLGRIGHDEPELVSQQSLLEQVGARHAVVIAVEFVDPVGNAVADGQQVVAGRQGRLLEVHAVAVECHGSFVLAACRVMHEVDPDDAVEDLDAVALQDPVRRVDDALEAGRSADGGKIFAEGDDELVDSRCRGLQDAALEQSGPVG